MSYAAEQTEFKFSLERGGISDEKIYRRLMSTIAHEAPIEELQKFFKLSKSENSDPTKIDFRARI